MVFYKQNVFIRFIKDNIDKLEVVIEIIVS